MFDEIDEDVAVANLLLGMYNPSHSNKAYIYSALAGVIAEKVCLFLHLFLINLKIYIHIDLQVKPSLRQTRLIKFSHLTSMIGDPSRSEKLLKYPYLLFNI